MFDFSEPVGFTIFCDDIRDEIGEKTSLIGVYHGVMMIHGAFPATLPKFAFHITILAQAKFMLERDLPIEFGVFLPGDEEGKPSYSSILPADPVSARAEYDNLPWQPSGPLIAHITLRWVVAPFILKGPGTIRVLARYKGDQIRCGTLQVIPVPAVAADADNPAS
jgi:hypothetical protein